MRILYLHRTQGRGVEGVHIDGIVNSFRKLGHDVHVVSPGDDRVEQNKCHVQDTKFRRFKRRLFETFSRLVPEMIFEIAELAYNLIAAKQLRAIAKTQTIDFIYERYAIFAMAGARYAAKWSVPHILEVNYVAQSPLVRKRSAVLRPLAVVIDKWLFAKATALVVVSSCLKEHLVKDYGVESHKVIVVPNAVDPDKFTVMSRDKALAAELGLGNGRVVGFVGGFYPWHGVDLLLKAYVLVADRFPETRLLLIGDGPEKQALAAEAARMGIEDKVVFTGTIAHEELPRYISLFSIGVLPDSNEYGSPMKIFEYMALGKPVVGPDCGPLLDVITPEQQGLIFRRKNVQSLADCLCRSLSDESLAARMAASARNMVETERNWLNNARRSLELVSGS